MKKKPKTHGGKREGSGRKSKFAEETVRIGFRVPESKVPEIKNMVEDKLKEFEKV